MHFVIHLTFALAFKEALSVDKLNEMSTIRVSVKWFDIELSRERNNRHCRRCENSLEKPLRVMKRTELHVEESDEEKYRVMFYIRNEGDCLNSHRNAGIFQFHLNSIEFFFDRCDLFLLYLFNQTLLFHFRAYFGDSTKYSSFVWRLETTEK